MTISDATDPKKERLPSKTSPFFATIKDRYILTKPGSSKETYHVSLDLSGSGMEFKGGDSIAVFAQNDPCFIERHLEVLRASGTERIVDPRTKELVSLHDFLTHKANLTLVNSALFKLICHDTSPLLDPENRSQLSTDLKTLRPLDLLEQHRDSPLPLQEFCNRLAPLLPRFYSAASSLKMIQNEVHLTVALTTFEHLGEKRYGLASHFLCHLAEVGSTRIPIYVQPARDFGLPDVAEAPMIMIGPGTGVAPFRAFMQERLAMGHSGKNWLFFGERNRRSDYFYEEFWSSLVDQDKLRLDLAFSRDQEEKIYVQHCMLERAKEVWAWIQQGAYIYVCGDAEKMAKSVDIAMQRIVQEQAGVTLEEAKKMLKTLRSQKRYLFDVY